MELRHDGAGAVRPLGDRGAVREPALGSGAGDQRPGTRRSQRLRPSLALITGTDLPNARRSLFRRVPLRVLSRSRGPPSLLSPDDASAKTISAPSRAAVEQSRPSQRIHRQSLSSTAARLSSVPRTYGLAPVSSPIRWHELGRRALPAAERMEISQCRPRNAARRLLPCSHSYFPFRTRRKQRIAP